MPASSRPPQIKPTFTRPATLGERVETVLVLIVGLAVNALIVWWMWSGIAAALAGFPGT